MSTDLICAGHIRQLVFVYFSKATPGAVLTFHLLLLVGGHIRRYRRARYTESNRQRAGMSSGFNPVDQEVSLRHLVARLSAGDVATPIVDARATSIFVSPPSAF